MAQKLAYSLRHAVVSIQDSDSPANSVDLSGPSVDGSYLNLEEITITKGGTPERIKDRGTLTDVAIPADPTVQEIELPMIRVAEDPMDAGVVTLLKGDLPPGWVEPLSLKIVETAGSQTRTITVPGITVGQKFTLMSGKTSGITSTLTYSSDAAITEVVTG